MATRDRCRISGRCWGGRVCNPPFFYWDILTKSCKNNGGFVFSPRLQPPRVLTLNNSYFPVKHSKRVGSGWVLSLLMSNLLHKFSLMNFHMRESEDLKPLQAPGNGNSWIFGGGCLILGGQLLPAFALRQVQAAQRGHVQPYGCLAGAPLVPTISQGSSNPTGGLALVLGVLILHPELSGSQGNGVPLGCSHSVGVQGSGLGFGIPPGSSRSAGCDGSRAPRSSARCAVPASVPTMPAMAPATPMRTRTCRSRCPRA